MVGFLAPLLGVFASQRAQKWLIVGGGLFGLWIWSQWWIARVEAQAQLELEIYLAKKAADVNKEVREYEQKLEAEIGDDIGLWYADELQRGWAAQPFASDIIGEGPCGSSATLSRDCAPAKPY